MTHVVINALSMRPGGGLQVMIAILAGMLKKERGQHYTVLWSDPNTERILKSWFAENLEVSFLNPAGSTNNMSLFLWQMRKLKCHLKTLKADVVLGLNHYFPSGDIPQIIYHVNVLRFERPKKGFFAAGELADRLRDRCTKLALRKAMANVFESSYLLKLAKAKVTEIRNPSLIYIGLEDPNAIKSSNYQKNGQPKLLALTSPQPHKDNPTLIRVLAELNTLRPNVSWELNIAGGTDPKAFSDLRDLATKLRVADQINWLGFQSHENLAKIGSESLCLVSTSRVESFCMVATEAMSWSCPSVVCDATSMPESIGEAGLLAIPGNPTDFANKVLSLYENDDLRENLIKEGYEQIATMNWTNAADSFSALILSMVKPT